MVTQHYDTLNAIGANSRSNLVLLPNSPTAASSMLNDLVVSIAAAQKIDGHNSAQLPDLPKDGGL
ncbi:hypothetical protein D3C72_2171900 [compost metagenome]